MSQFSDLKKFLFFLILFIGLAGCAPKLNTNTLSPDQKEYWKKVQAMDTKFTVPKSIEKEAWARANDFISSYASMKIQTVTEFSIETYSSPI